MYSIESERGSNVVAIVVSGFWTLETVQAFAADLSQVLRARGSHEQRVLVLGFEDAVVAPGPVIEALRQLAAAAAGQAGRMALYTSSALKRLQLRRIADVRLNSRVFATREDAMEWVRAT